jgi:glycosyltransferase involved in cell wall biosynthesis
MKEGFWVEIPMCVYNHEKYISQAIESILSQKTNFNFRLIIGEDCSKDNTRQIILDYEKINPEKIKVILNEMNIGAYENTKNLFKICTAKYIALCDGDDYWTDPYKLQKQVDFLEKNAGFSGCFHYTKQLNENGQFGITYGNHSNKTKLSTIDTFSSVAPFHTSSFLFLNSALKLPEWFNKVLGGDLVIFSVVSSKGYLGCVPEVMSIYRKHPGGFTKSAIATEQNHHTNRIKLMHYLDQYHEFKFHKQAMKVIKFHEDGLKGIYRYTPYEKLKNQIKKIIKAIK